MSTASPQHSRNARPQHPQLLQTAVEQANDAVLITEGAPLDDPGPRITYVNPAFTEITGYTSSDVLGKTPRLLQGPATESWVLARLRRRLEEGKPFEGEAINYRKDGTPYVNHWSIAPVRNPNDVITHWVSVQRDVTEQRRTGERLLSVQEQERARMARTIHDELGGRLTSLQLLVDRLGALAADDQREAASLLDELQTQINALSGTVRRLTDISWSRVLADFGLAEAVSRLMDEFEEEHGLTIDLYSEISSGERLSSLLERVVFRILREVLTDVARREDTESVQVLLNKTDRKLRMHVIDHGNGLESGVEHRHGLSGMEERIDQLNGTLSLRSRPDGDAQLTVTLPLTLISLPQSGGGTQTE